MVIEILLNPCCNIVLEILLGSMLGIRLEPELLDALLASRAGRPSLLREIVTTDMNILLREHLHNLVENTLDEFEGSLLTRAKHFVSNTPNRSHGIRTACTTELRI